VSTAPHDQALAGRQDQGLQARAVRPTAEPSPETLVPRDRDRALVALGHRAGPVVAVDHPGEDGHRSDAHAADPRRDLGGDADVLQDGDVTCAHVDQTVLLRRLGARRGGDPGPDGGSRDQRDGRGAYGSGPVVLPPRRGPSRPLAAGAPVRGVHRWRPHGGRPMTRAGNGRHPGTAHRRPGDLRGSDETRARRPARRWVSPPAPASSPASGGVRAGSRVRTALHRADALGAAVPVRRSTSGRTALSRRCRSA
jgi:hypothetical protein